jgi:uncharacterized membrane protein YdjX (TVP38/TMEM64 family)
MSDFTSAARSLALPIDDENDSWTRRSNNSNSNSPAWRRRSQSESTQPRNPSATTRWLRSANRLTNKLQRAFLGLTPIQQGGLVALNVALLIFGILFAVYNERIFAYLSPAAKRWRDTPGGWLVLWALTFFVSFPPMIGYSTCVTVAGFVWGMYGWFIVASATIIGSTASFIVSRTVLRKYVSRLAERNKRFAALSLVLKHDGIMLLIMIRLCPLPYSFSNGAISTIPTVTWQNYMLATACITPKLLLHIFVGRQIGLLAEEGSKMDFKTKMISYLSIAIGMAAGIATGYFIYVKTKARAEQLEAEEAAAAGTGANGGEDARRRMSDAGPDYLDDPDVEAAALRRDPDDFSLHTTYADDERGGVGGRGGYLDDFTDDEDARERDVFDDGDGSMTGDEEDGRLKGER